MENPGEQQGGEFVRTNFVNHFNNLLKVVGLLVVAWGSTVLLGGFAATLEMKDFVFVSLICLYQFIHVNCLIQVLDQECMAMQVFWATCSVAVIPLSATQLAFQNFGETEDAHKATRDLALNVFYIMALIDGLLNIVFNALYFTSKFI